VADKLAEQEFEVYLVRDHARLKRVLAREPDAVVFVNLDDGLDETGWESYIRSLRNDEKTAQVGVGIVTLNEDKTLMQKYLMEIGLPCGYVILKIGSAKTTEILSKTLEANEARGRRKFVRAACPPGTAQFVVEFDGSTRRGEVSDISSAGAAIAFDDGLRLKAGTVLRSLQLSVKGARFIADGFVVAQRAAEGETSTLVVMFDPASLDDNKRERIRSLVFRVNQATMERLLAIS